MPNNKIEKNDKTFFKKLEDNSLFFDFNKVKKEETNNVNTNKDFINENLLSSKDLESIPRADFIPDNISTVPMQTLKIVVFCACVFLIAIINFMFLENYKKDKLKIDEDLAKTDANTAALNAEYRAKVAELGQNSSVSTKIDIINSLSKEHIYWSRCLNIIENKTLNESIINSMSADASGVINISMASKSYKDMALQTQEFKKIKEIKEVKMSGASSSSSNVGYSVGYNITMDIDKSFYLKQ